MASLSFNGWNNNGHKEIPTPYRGEGLNFAGMRHAMTTERGSFNDRTPPSVQLDTKEKYLHEPT
jgi:hypothetical protein